MNSRLKIFGLIALLGFVAGIIAQVTATYIIPWLVSSSATSRRRINLPDLRIRRRMPNSRTRRRLGLHDWQKRTVLKQKPQPLSFIHPSFLNHQTFSRPNFFPFSLKKYALLLHFKQNSPPLFGGKTSKLRLFSVFCS